ncbi:hypothetical protein GCM10010912_00970 [Paenibacillus albidus]|uniref:DUF269 domain-containing protein n=1 Tax=Paenibacillus albidus TaxID=2041023 RepID=A0A917F8A7_9BACL|nr:DUF269 domain-containing protein [Paenibacillus albidus]GGF59572.1 hypothetical protein GCM10010912_00970 [Paenibacillus albidus]
MAAMASEGGAGAGRRNQEGAATARRSRAVERDVDQVLEEAFIRRLCQLLDAGDFFGRHAALPAEEKISAMFLASLEDKRQSDLNCMVSPKVQLQVPLLFQAAAGVMEEKCGWLIQSSAEINGEGFGRALLYSGRMILVLKSLRAGFPFPFTSGDKAILYGVACVEEGLAFMDKYNEKTALHGLLSLEG